MKTIFLFLAFVIFSFSLFSVPPKQTDILSVPILATIDRSPTDLALIPGSHLALTANHTADTVSLIDLNAGNVITETPVGKKPFAVAVTPDGKRAVATNLWSDDVTVLKIEANGLQAIKTIPVGDEPRGIAMSRDGKRAYVALGGAESVAVIDMITLTVVKRLPVGLEPWHLALTPDGSHLAVGNTRGRTVSVLDTRTGQEAFTLKVLGRNLRHIAVSGDGEWAYLPTISERGQGVTKQNIDRGWVVGNRLTRVPLSHSGPREAITLDIQGNAVGDVDGIALSPDGQQIALTAGGTHELLLLRLPDLPFVSYGGPGDHLEPALQDDLNRFRRIKLGGRPLGAVYTPDGKNIVVANYLLNSVQVIDPATASITKTIALGGPTEPSLARRGESIFMDANRSFGSWYSCNSCHTEGHSDGGNFDTLNDGGFGKPKKTPSLRGVADTAPYTWHGWQKTLRGALGESLRKTMQGPDPTEADIDAMEAYVKTLTFPPSPFRNPDGTLTPAAKRGEGIFAAKDCVSCHPAPTFTNGQVVLVGLEEPDDVYKGFNPPSLRGIYSRAPYLHDGRAKTLEEVLTVYHKPSQLTGKPDCTPQELTDLVAYLKSL